MILLIYFFINFFSITSSYLTGEIAADFEDYINMSIAINFRTISKGIILYAIDTNNNYLLITTGKKFPYNELLFFDLNGMLFNKSAKRTFWSHELRMNLILQQSHAYFQFDEIIIILKDILFNQMPSENISQKKLNNGKGKINLWLGDIELEFKNHLAKETDLNPNLIGCIIKFTVNDWQINFQKFGDRISLGCWKRYKEVVSKEKLSKKIFHVLDCSFRLMNTKEFCYRKLIFYSGSTHSYVRISKDTRETTMKIAWKQNHSNNYCLMEIILTSRMIILIHTNHLDDVIICIKSLDSMFCKTRIIDKVILNQLNILLVNFTSNSLMIKFTSGGDVKQINEISPGNVTDINVGISEKTKFCKIFEGYIDFRYNVSHFKSFYSSKIRKLYPIYTSQFILSVAVIMLIVSCIILFMRAFANLKKNKENSNNKPTLIENQKYIATIYN